MDYEILNAKVISIDDFRHILETRFPRDENGDRLGIEYSEGYIWIGYPNSDSDMDYVMNKISEILEITEITGISTTINDDVVITYR